MNLKRCSNGHFYDVDKYATCPHCAGASGVDDSMASTVAYGASDATVGYTVPDNQGATLGSTVAYDGNAGNMGISLMSEQSIPTTPNNGATKAGSLEGWLKDHSQDTTSGWNDPDEDDQKTQRHSSLDSNVEPVVGWLVCLNGEDAGKSFTLKSGRNFIGRGADMDVVLSGDMSVSREKHAIILYEPKKRVFLAQPGESKELFYVNDEVVLNVTSLNTYDKIAIGNTELYFVPFCGEVFAWEDLGKVNE